MIGLYLSNGYIVGISEQESGKDEPNQTVVALQQFQKEDVSIKRIQRADLTPYGETLIEDYPAPFDFQANPKTQEFIDGFAQDAQQLGLDYDLFASVLIAQAILESASGTSQLANSPHHNLFGIKGSYQGNSVVFSTMEDRGNGELYEIKAAFRSYSDYHGSMEDYVSLIRGGIQGNDTFYQAAWRSESKNYLRVTEALTGSYATDVIYHQKLNSLIAVYDLTQYDQALGTETGLFIQGKEHIPEEYRSLMSFPAYNGKDYNVSGAYPVGQCTWYVFNRVAQLGGRVDDYMGNGGQWGATGECLGYQVSRIPKTGTVISFAPGSAGSDICYGHVAFVEAVGPTGILISEGNVYGGTTISYRVISRELAYSSYVSYITPK